MSRRLERTEKHLRLREVRCSYHTLPTPGALVENPEAAAAVLSNHFETTPETVEVLVALYLDTRGRVIATAQLHKGTINLHRGARRRSNAAGHR